MLIYWLSELLLWILLSSRFQPVVPYLQPQPLFLVLVFMRWRAWAKVLVSLYFMAMTCNTGGLRQQGGMDVAMDLYLAIWLLFTNLALVLASVFVRLWGAKGEQPWELLVAEPAQEHGCRDQEGGKEEAEELSPAANPSPAAAESIPRQLPTEPQEDAGDHAALPSKAEEGGLDSDKEQLMVGEPASTAATPAPVTSTAASFESSEGSEWPLGTLETCLPIVMGITMLARILSVVYPQPFCLVPRVKQSGLGLVWGQTTM